MKVTGITYEIIPPCKELKDFISHFWFSRWETGVQDHFIYHSTANTCTEFVFAFRPGNNYGKIPVFSSLQAHTDKYCCITTGGLSEMFGVSIYSYAIPFFFEYSVSALTDQLVDLSEIIGRDAVALANRLADAHYPDKRATIMTSYLKKKFNTSRSADFLIIDAIKKMRQTQGQINVRHLASEFSLSQKQFERRFKAFSGFNPKLYSSILRFESSLSPFNETTSLTNKALDLGYYDQAHFINDFRRFSGFSPGKYVPVSTH